MKFNKKRIVGISLYSFGIATFIALSATAQVVCNIFGTTFHAALGDFGQSHSSVHYEGVDPTYYTSDFDNKDDASKFQKDSSYNIVKEGITLLEEGNLPYAKNTKVSLFSKSSVNFIFGGTGSGVASSDLNLKDVFESNSFDVNDSLWKFYKDGAGKKYKRGVGSINYGDSDDYSINECPLPIILNDNEAKTSCR